MPAFITKRPEKTVSGNVSRWSAVTNPVTFKVERQDLNIIGVGDNNGLVEVATINILDLLPFGTAVGDKIYLKSGNYDAVGTIQAFPSPGKFTLDLGFIDNASGGIINMITNRINYRLQVRILVIINNLYTLLVTRGQFRPNEKGIALIDIRSWLKTVPKMINEFQYDILNQKDENLGGRYVFQIRELFTDASETFEGVFLNPDDGNINFFVNAARQIQDEHGGNMAQFVPFGTDVVESEKMLFLSGFVQPSRFVGFPFDLQFIYSDIITNRIVKKEERSRDINDLLKDSNSDELDNSHSPNVNRLTLNEGYDILATSVDVWITVDAFIFANPKEWSIGDYDEGEFDGGIPPDVIAPKGEIEAIKIKI